VHNAADDAAIVHPLDAPYIRRQLRFDPIPLLIAQPKQIPAHDPDPLPKTNQDRIVTPEKLMSSDPSKKRWQMDGGFGEVGVDQACCCWSIRGSAGLGLSPECIRLGDPSQHDLSETLG
jgi:hypothetical protein